MPSSDPVIVAARAAGLAVAALLGWQAVSLGIAARIESSRDGAAAAAFGARTPGNRALIAERQLAAGNAAGAFALAREAALDAPIQVRPLRVSGLAAERRGDIRTGAAMMNLAGRLGWRDTPTQLWLLTAAVESEDRVSAVQRADALARRQQAPEITRAFFQEVLIDDAMRALIADRLAEGPTWRTGFFVAAEKLPAKLRPSFERLLADLDRSPRPATRAEVGSYVAGLLTTGQARHAREIWLRRGRLPGRPALLYDGGFDHAATPDGVTGSVFAFEWQVGGDGGGSATIDPENGRALRIDSGSLGGTILAAQTVVVSPGGYRLAARVKADQGDLAAAVGWSISCVGGSATIAARRVEGGAGSVTADFDVPANCPAQRIELRTQASGGGAGGTIDDVALTRRGAA